jgi:hypothetical protein
MEDASVAGSKPAGQSPAYPLLSRTVIVPPDLGWPALTDADPVAPGLLLPLLLHAAATTTTAIPRLAVVIALSLNPMAFTYSRRLLH